MPPSETPQGIWRGHLSESSCSWVESDTPGEWRLAIAGSVLAALLILATLAPIFFTGLGFSYIAAIIKGESSIPIGTFSDPLLWTPVLGTSALGGILLFLLFSRARVVSFVFDRHAKQVIYIKKRFFISSAPIRSEFHSILKVVPVLLNTYANEGHFEVTLRDHRGRQESLWIGHSIPVSELTRHAEWLSLALPNIVQPLLQLDC